MFRKTIQNIETRINGNTPTYPQTDMPTGFNTQRYDRFPPMPQEQKPGQRKNISSGQFSQLKKLQANKTSELVIRQCDPTELNHHYKKPTIMRPIEENVYQQYGPPSNSSNKKQRLPINPPLRKAYDSNYKQPLQEIHFSDRDNKSTASDRYSSSTNIDPGQYYDLQQQFQALKQYIAQSQNDQATEVKKLKTSLNQVQVECMGELENVANQVSREFNKQKEELLGVNKRGVDTQRELRYLKDSFNSFVKDNEEKIESLVLDLNGGGSNKKSRTNEEFGVDLKSSSHCISGGVGTSMSVNFQNDNINLKLYNETSAQIEMLKSELELCKQKIELLQKDTKILQLERKTPKEEVKESVKDKIDLKEVEKLIIEKFSQQRKKNLFSEKIQDLDLKTKDLYKVYQDIDSNIKGMNAEFTRVINGTVIKKEKMLEAKLGAAQEKLNELSQRLSLPQLQQTIRTQIQPQLTNLLQQKSSSMKIIKVREPTAQQKPKLNSVKNPEFTYLMDEEGYLLDPSGSYVVESLENGNKQKIKIEKNVMYLLESQGIEILKGV